MSEAPAGSTAAADAAWADAERSTWMADALTGADGTADPRQPLARADFFADGTAEPTLRSPTAGRLPEIPVPQLPLPVVGQPAATVVARSAVAPRSKRSPMGAQPLRLPPPSLPPSDRVPISVATYAGPVGPPPSWRAPTSDLPPPAQQFPVQSAGQPPAVQQFLNRFPNISVPGTNPGPAPFLPANQPFAGANQPTAYQPPRVPVRPAPPSRPRPTQNKSRGSAVWSVLVLLVIILFASGLGQQIIKAIEQAINK